MLYKNSRLGLERVSWSMESEEGTCTLFKGVFVESRIMARRFVSAMQSVVSDKVQPLQGMANEAANSMDKASTGLYLLKKIADDKTDMRTYGFGQRCVRDLSTQELAALAKLIMYTIDNVAMWLTRARDAARYFEDHLPSEEWIPNYEWAKAWLMEKKGNKTYDESRDPDIRAQYKTTREEVFRFVDVDHEAKRIAGKVHDKLEKARMEVERMHYAAERLNFRKIHRRWKNGDDFLRMYENLEKYAQKVSQLRMDAKDLIIDEIWTNFLNPYLPAHLPAEDLDVVN